MLVITARRQQAHTALGELKELGFEHYQEVPQQTSLASVDRLILQYESLHRLMSEDSSFRPYDLVLVDEVRSVAAQICAPTNKEHLSTNAAICKALLRGCPRSLLMDADVEVDPLVSIVAHEIWAPDEVLLHRYTHVALQRQLMVLPLPAWMHSLRSTLEQQHRVMVVFRTKKHMETVLASVREWFPQIRCLAFSSDSTEDDMKAFQHINAETERVQLLCFTSKVTVGADIQTSFQQVYVHARSAGGCSARDVFQMIGRARNLTDTNVRVVLPCAGRGEQGVVTPESKLKEVLAQRALRQKYAAAVSRTEPTLVNGEFRWSPDWITRVLACHLAEQASDFTAAFGFLAQHKGYAVVPGEYQMAADVTAAMLQDIQRIAEQVDVNHGAVEAAVLQAIHRGTQEPNTLQDTLRELELAVTQGRATPQDCINRKFLRVWQRFPARFWQMTLEDVRYAEAHMSAFFKLHWLKNAGRTQDARWQDLNKLNSAPLPELAKMSFGQVFCVNAAASAVGLRGVLRL